MSRVPVNSIGLPETIWFDDEQLCVLDQTELPHSVWPFVINSVDDAFEAIARMHVRGAPAIGITAAYGMVVDRPSLIGDAGSVAEVLMRLEDRHRRLVVARPTAVNLRWALDRMRDAAQVWAEENDSGTPRQIYEHLVQTAKTIHTEDRQMCGAIGQHGKSLIDSGHGVLTHCNAGSLATSEHGTATAPMYAAHGDGVAFSAFVDETRPRLQGAKLTAWELSTAGIDTTLLCDNMAASLMAAGRVQLILVGTDRVTTDGSVANKIGTLPLAIVAKHYGIPLYVAFATSTLDRDLDRGDEIPIEHRGGNEVVRIGEHLIAPDDVRVYSPAFDVTPGDLVTGYITQTGVYRAEEFERLLREAE